MVDGSTQATIPRRASQTALRTKKQNQLVLLVPLVPLVPPSRNLRSSPDFLHSLYCRLLLLAVVVGSWQLLPVACCLAGCLFTAKSNKQLAAIAGWSGHPPDYQVSGSSTTEKQLQFLDTLSLRLVWPFVLALSLLPYIGFVIFNFALVSRSAPALLIISLKAGGELFIEKKEVCETFVYCPKIYF